MAFNSLPFLFFLAVSLSAFNLASQRFRPLVLLVSSYVFYCTFSPFFLLAILWVSAWCFVGAAYGRTNIRLATLAVTAILLPLFLTKGATLLGSTTGRDRWDVIYWLAPLGFAFYSLQAVGYIVDVRRKAYDAEPRPLRVALFLSFFPSLLSGPIGRAPQLLPQLERLRRTTPIDTYIGLKLLLWGFFCKYVVADNLATIVNRVYSDPQLESGGSLALAAVCFSYQLYFDFLGYSVIAVALARLFGIRLIDNFDRPYAASSLREFWRRWHISLSTWFRDYVYRPLGGRETTGSRRTATVLTVFFLSGSWHGGALNFLCWGAFHGIAYIVEDAFRRTVRPIRQVSAITRFARVVATFTIVTSAWILFRVTNPADWATIVGRIGFFDQTIDYLTLNAIYFQPASALTLICALSAVAVDASTGLRDVLVSAPKARYQLVPELAIVNWMIVALVLFGDQSSSSFVYFAF